MFKPVQENYILSEEAYSLPSGEGKKIDQAADRLLKFVEGGGRLQKDASEQLDFAPAGIEVSDYHIKAELEKLYNYYIANITKPEKTTNQGKTEEKVQIPAQATQASQPPDEEWTTDATLDELIQTLKTSTWEDEISIGRWVDSAIGVLQKLVETK